MKLAFVARSARWEAQDNFCLEKVKGSKGINPYKSTRKQDFGDINHYGGGKGGKKRGNHRATFRHREKCIGGQKAPITHRMVQLE